jgi:hypothetical protein
MILSFISFVFLKNLRNPEILHARCKNKQQLIINKKKKGSCPFSIALLHIISAKVDVNMARGGHDFTGTRGSLCCGISNDEETERMEMSS